MTAVRVNTVQTEVFPLAMFSVAGMLIFVAAGGDLLTMFVALEVFSLPLYLMCGLARRRRLLSQEAALKYFLLGAFSSAFFLYGIALLYGYSGTLSLPGIARAVETGTDSALALAGTALVAVGVLFKVGAVPFHSWIPRRLSGRPTPITAFMAAATKVAAFGAMLRIFYVALPGLDHDWRPPVLSLIAMVTMVAGAVLAVGQTDLKRLLGYSAVAQAGFILTGVIAADGTALSATLFYLATYALATLGAFAVIGLVRNHTGTEETAIANWAGLGRRHPLTAVVFSLFLLAFAGIPLTSGFIGKFAVFSAAAHGGQLLLVLVGVIASAVTAFVYAKVVVMMYADDTPHAARAVHTPDRLTGISIATAAGGHSGVRSSAPPATAGSGECRRGFRALSQRTVSSALRRSNSRSTIGGVKMSCIARSILPPGGQTMVLARDMNESCSIDSRYGKSMPCGSRNRMITMDSSAVGIDRAMNGLDVSTIGTRWKFTSVYENWEQMKFT